MQVLAIHLLLRGGREAAEQTVVDHLRADARQQLLRERIADRTRCTRTGEDGELAHMRLVSSM